MSSTKTATSRTFQSTTSTCDSQAYANGENAISGPCQVLRVIATNLAAGTKWVALFDAATATGTPRLVPIAVPAGTTISIDLNSQSGQGWCGVSFANALTWAASSAAIFRTRRDELRLGFDRLPALRKESSR